MKRSVLNRTFQTERFIGAAAAAKNRWCAPSKKPLVRARPKSPAFTTADQQHDDNGNYHSKML